MKINPKLRKFMDEQGLADQIAQVRKDFGPQEPLPSSTGKFQEPDSSFWVTLALVGIVIGLIMTLVTPSL